MTTPPPISEISRRAAATFLVTPSRRIIGQHRDDKPGIDNPGKIGPFGGVCENDESPIEAAWREVVEEETNLKLEPVDFIPLTDLSLWRELTKEWEIIHFFYVQISEQEVRDLKIYEGQGWAYIDSLDDPRLIRMWSDAYQKIFEVTESL